MVTDHQQVDLCRHLREHVVRLPFHRLAMDTRDLRHPAGRRSGTPPGAGLGVRPVGGGDDHRRVHLGVQLPRHRTRGVQNSPSVAVVREGNGN
jgi:hypothetical protein